jgi:gamma-glutamylputrescine oxidase
MGADMSDLDMPSIPLWWAEPSPPLPPLGGEMDVEVLIIGGGIAGMTLAWTLAEQGAHVGLLEAGAIAGAASGRNAGFLLAAPAEPYQELIALWGRPGARAMLEIGRRSHRRIRHLAETLGIECDYRALGSMRLSVTEEEAEDTRASLPLMKADGFVMEEIRVGDAVPEDVTDKFAAAFFTVEDGELDPVRFLRGLTVATLAHGARIHEQSRVIAARWQAGLWEARTEGGIVRARTLVLATNAYAPELCPALASLIVPRRGQMLATAPIARTIAPRPTYAHWGYRYWRQTRDGRLVIGGWRDLDRDAEVGYDVTPTRAIQAGIERGLLELVPEGAPIEHRWAGTMGFARDGRPLVGWLDASHHLAVCAGFTGHGMGMAAACTQDLAALLSWKDASGISSFDPSRFPELRKGSDSVTVLGAATV